MNKCLTNFQKSAPRVIHTAYFYSETTRQRLLNHSRLALGGLVARREANLLGSTAWARFSGPQGPKVSHQARLAAARGKTLLDQETPS